MRIAVWYNMKNGGAKRALYHHVMGLVERGHSVEVWCTPRSLDGYLPLGETVKEHVVPVRDWFVPSGPVVNAFAHCLDVRGQRRAIEEHCRICAEEINSGDFDVVFVNSCGHTVVSAIGRFLTGPKVLYLPEPSRWLYESRFVFSYATQPSHCNIIRTLLSESLRQSQRRYELDSANSYDLILVNSLYSRESILRAYGRDSRVCYLGIDTDVFVPGPQKRERYVVGLGEIDARKGVDRALRAIATIDPSLRPDLVWIGNRADADYQRHVISLAGRLGVNLTIKLLVSDAELVQTIGAAGAMVYTSRLEPFGLAPLEACACETPVVAVAEGGLRETIIDGVNGLTVDSDDPRALGAAIVRLLDDSVLSRNLGVRGRQIVMEEWTWSAAVDRLEGFLVGMRR